MYFKTNEKQIAKNIWRILHQHDLPCCLAQHRICSDLTGTGKDLASHHIRKITQKYIICVWGHITWHGQTMLIRWYYTVRGWRSRGCEGKAGEWSLTSGWSWKFSKCVVWQRKYQLFSYLSDGLTGLSCVGSWIPWRVLYRNPSKSLNECVPLYCSPVKTYKYLLIFLFPPWLARLFIVPLNLSASCFTITASFAFGARIWSRFNSRSSWIKSLQHFLLFWKFTWNMRRSIWYFRTCTGAPSVTVWKVQLTSG